MKNITYWLLSCAMLLSLPLMAEQPPQRILWKKTPISLHLTVGEERLVTFPDEVAVGVPAEITDSLRTLSVDDTVYWLAEAPFETTRIQVRETASGRTYLLDLTALEKPDEQTTATRPPVVIHVEQSTGQSALDQPETTVPQAEAPPALDYVTLMRYAAQQLYAPQRLLGNDARIHRVPLRVQEGSLPLLRGGEVEAHPVIGWVGDGYYLTAIKLVNKSDHGVSLDPRDLRGRWLAATLQHAYLHPAGHPADTTALYVISRQPFDESL